MSAIPEMTASRLDFVKDLVRDADEDVLIADHLHVALESDAGLVKALDGVRLSVARGETFALVGESGCGKSMTAMALMRLLPDNGRIDEGSVRLNEEELLILPESRMRERRGGKIGIIFQDPSTSLNPVLKVGDQEIGLGGQRHRDHHALLLPAR